MGNALSVLGNAAQLAVAVGIPLGCGFGIGLWTAPEVKGWYRKIKKPKWNPPNWLFGPVWSLLYVSQGIASWLVFRQGFKANLLPLGIYTIQLLINLAWNPLFFKAQRIDLALLDIIAMDVFVGATIAEFSGVIGVPATAALMGPYAAWISFATVLNAWIYLNNRESAKSGSEPLLAEAAAGADAAAETVSDKVAEAVASTQAAITEAEQKVQEAVPQ